ncbi:flagellar hook-length control protein FliK [Salinisphaera sp. LB1]|uniref:flagellar hook-length control protein FliK n=1 Tax=Salinisphaera sp. LB1 TaxID=2183911 RepID=UPI000D707161|nr:flagellar hook-length control protein FliK [Salinisphaera sp. LB1]AWN15998.1 hypothetical protein SALB1_1800 [Salinisphaera sp. LB1]
MGTITPILDTLLPQVSGRAGDVARIGARAAHGPLSALRPVSGDMSPLAPRGAIAYPGRDSSAASVRGASAPRARSHAPDAEKPSARDIARAIASGGGRQPSAQLHLSRGGGALARLLGEVTIGHEPLPVTRAQPLAAGAPRPSDLAALLAQQVTSSGLFYESHLAAWVRGRFPRARLEAESQARPGAGSSQQSTTAQADPQGAPAPESPQANANAASIDPRLATLVRQQIELLAGGVFQWQGEAWAGAPMRWSIEPESDGPAAGEPEGSLPVTTALSLDLPGLGAVEARLQVAGDHISVAAWAEDGAGRRLMAADMARLRRRLRQAGFGAPSVRLVTEPGA